MENLGPGLTRTQNPQTWRIGFTAKCWPAVYRQCAADSILQLIDSDYYR